MQTTVAYEMSQHERMWNIEILSDFKSKLKSRVKSPHRKGYCINAVELKGQDSEDTPCRNNRLERKMKESWSKPSWAKLALTVSRVSFLLGRVGWAELVSGPSWPTSVYKRGLGAYSPEKNFTLLSPQIFFHFWDVEKLWNTKIVISLEISYQFGN